MSFEEARARFPILQRVAYLNAGTFGPLAQATIETVESTQRADIAAGRSGKAWFEAMLPRATAFALRSPEAGAEPAQVALTRSTGDGINIVVAGLRLEPGDEVVTTDVEHFSLIGPLVAAGVQIKVARLRGMGSDDAFELIRAEVTPRTKLIAISAVSWLTGNVLPVAEVREATGVPVLVDGAQSVGAIPVETQSVDFTTISGQKWLCGPESTGGLVVRDPETLGLSQISYFAAETYDLEQATFEVKAGAQRFDQGWTPTPALAGLEAALTDLPEWRYDRARETRSACGSCCSKPASTS